jgi:hypothetical protein
MRRALFFAAALAALAACERKSEALKPEQPAKPAETIREVAAADGFGDPGETVNDVAFWSHPTVAFQSLVIAATPDALRSFNVETREPIGAATDAAGLTSIEMIYALEAGATTKTGYVIGAANGRYIVRRIDEGTRAFDTILVDQTAPAAGGFCAGRVADGLAIFEFGDESLARRSFAFNGMRAAVGDPAPLASSGGLIACMVDERANAVITVARDGAIRRIEATTGEAFGIALPQDATPDSAGAAFSRTAEGVDGGQVAALDGETGVIRLFDLSDGHALGAVRVKATFDLDAIAKATSIAVGSANYGNVYRDGALAVVTADAEGAPIRLVPWNGVLGALDVALGEGFNPRGSHAEAEEEDNLSIELTEP